MSDTSPAPEPEQQSSFQTERAEAHNSSNTAVEEISGGGSAEFCSGTHEEKETRVSQQLGKLQDQMEIVLGQLNTVKGQFAQVEGQFAQVEGQFAQLEGQIQQLNFGHLDLAEKVQSLMTTSNDKMSKLSSLKLQNVLANLSLKEHLVDKNYFDRLDTGREYTPFKWDSSMVEKKSAEDSGSFIGYVSHVRHLLSDGDCSKFDSNWVALNGDSEGLELKISRRSTSSDVTGRTDVLITSTYAMMAMSGYISESPLMFELKKKSPSEVIHIRQAKAQAIAADCMKSTRHRLTVVVLTDLGNENPWKFYWVQHNCLYTFCAPKAKLGANLCRHIINNDFKGFTEAPHNLAANGSKPDDDTSHEGSETYNERLSEFEGSLPVEELDEMYSLSKSQQCAALISFAGLSGVDLSQLHCPMILESRFCDPGH